VFPTERPRRLRRTPALRRLVAETTLAPDDFVAPLFVAEGLSDARAISSLPGHFQHTVDSLRHEVKELLSVGVGGVILFGVPSTKDELGSGAWDPDGIAQVALRVLRDDFGDELVLMADLCLDEYTRHGHCGVLRADGTVDNDATLELYGRVAVAQAEAGASVVAPSGMMDGQVAAIRAGLDRAGHHGVGILAYAAKYASAFYGPFREAADSAPAFGDRRTYQMDPANGREAAREVRLDVAEGADILMVKPALAYMDLIRQTREQIDLPVACYNVSGEYSMLKAAAERGWIDEERAVDEMLTGFARAGADIIITYFAKDYLKRRS